VASVQDFGVAAPITGLSHIQLMVSDVQKSAEWYTAALSVVPYAQDLELGYVALRQPGARMVLVLTQRRNGDGSDVVGGPLDHLAFAVSDGDTLHRWAEHLAGLGIEHAGVVLESGRPSLQLRDPDGIAIELVA